MSMLSKYIERQIKKKGLKNFIIWKIGRPENPNYNMISASGTLFSHRCKNGRCNDKNDNGFYYYSVL